MDDTAIPTIGILDSGVGGLSVLREIHARSDKHSLIYVADSAWCPYGSRPAREIRNRVFQVTEFLLAAGAEIIVVACNSATIAAVEALRAAYPVAFVGMEPGIKPASRLTRSGVIGVLATEASLAGEKFHRLLHAHAPELRVITRPCPDFVTLVETGTLEGKAVDAAIDLYARPLVEEEGADVLVLGCTHYPFLAPAIRRRLDPGVELVATGEAVARRTLELLPSLQLTAEARPSPPPIKIFTSGCAEDLSDLLPSLVPEIVPVVIKPLPE